jgi:hypothetical protein
VLKSEANLILSSQFDIVLALSSQSGIVLAFSSQSKADNFCEL